MGADEILEGLTEPQRRAVLHRGGPLLIVAGAGSGKTRVLTRRIAHLLASGDARPHESMAITFTNKAAGEMRERVEDLFGPRAKRMLLATFHSACLRILRANATRIGFEPGPPGVPGGGQSFYGSSFLADHRGDLVQAFERTDEGVLTASYDLDYLQTHRAAWGFFRDRRTDLYDAIAPGKITQK